MQKWDGLFAVPPQTVKKASQSLRPQAQIKFKAFLPAACTSAKILLGSQTCERKRVRCGEPQPFQTRAQRSGSRWKACQKSFFDTLKWDGLFAVPPIYIEAEPFPALPEKVPPRIAWLIESLVCAAALCYFIPCAAKASFPPGGCRPRRRRECRRRSPLPRRRDRRRGDSTAPFRRARYAPARTSAFPRP